MTQARLLPTSLGPPLRRAGQCWTIDLTELPLFHGLSVLSRALGERIVEHCLTERLDIDVEYRIRPAENPELAALGCEGVKVLAERDVVAHVPEDIEAFQHHLRAVFGTLQRERWRTLLLPDGQRAEARALVFTFPVRKSFDYRFVVDRVPSGSANGRFFLRIAIENPRGRRLDLSSLPHAVVDDLSSREYIAGSTRIAQTLRDLMQRQADRGRRTHLERRKEGSFIFGQLEKGGFGQLTLLNLTWTERFGTWLVQAESERLDHVLKKVMLLLEDLTVRQHLRAGDTMNMADGELQVFLDLSQRSRVLNLAFGEARRRVNLEQYLARMPALAEVARHRAAERPLAELSVLLVHHVTAEVLGLVAALRALGCTDLCVLFVRYAGDIPNEYLEALLDLDEGVWSFALRNIKGPSEVEGHFILSRQFSPLAGLEGVQERLRARPTRFFDAMVSLGTALFVRQLARAEAAGRRLLVIEDGGYVMPTVTRAAAAGWTLRALGEKHGAGAVPPSLARRRLTDVLVERLIGSVEHTRNGLDRLAAVERELGRLVRPAFSIAVSRLKVEEESEEVAAGVLAAVEAVYHALGHVLSHRRPLVIGCRGAIGRCLARQLSTRVGANPVLGIDLRAAHGGKHEARAWQALPTALRRGVDLVIGVTGQSVLGAIEAEELVLHGTAPMITFASGSTKTVEFRAVADWVERLLQQSRPRLDGRPVEIAAEEVLDPQSGRLYGTAVTVRLRGGRQPVDKRLLFVANLTPVNFLFYGVPTETMDRVMAQLLRASLGLVRRVGARGDLAPRLYAVDRDIPDSRL